MEKTTGFFITVFVIMMLIAIYLDILDYVNDSVLFIFLTLLTYKFRKLLNLSLFGYYLLFVAMLMHNLGVFGFYGKFEFYDILTHIYGLAAISFNIYFLLIKYVKVKWFLILGAILISGGIGVIIENIEYSGYILLGNGEGVFLYGDGDIETGINGAWIDAMEDLINNWVGALIGLLSAIMLEKLLRS